MLSSIRFVRVVLFSALLTVLSIRALGQGGSVVRQVVAPTVAQNGTGQPASFALIRVCTATATGTPCSPLVAQVYADQALTESLPAAFAADVNGMYSFFAPTGEYLIQESNAIGAGYTFTYSYLTFLNGTGTVSSVGLALPSSVFSISGSPVTSSGTLTGAFIPQSADTVFGNCTSGSAIPSFCALTTNMIPGTLNSTTIDGTLTTVSSGNTSIGGTLGVTGLATFNSNSQFNGNINTTGSVGILNSLTVGAGIVDSGALSVAAGATIGTILGVGVVNATTYIGAPFITVTNGYQIGSSYGTNGYCLQSTGSGTAFSPSCSPGGVPTFVLGTGAGSGGTITPASGYKDKLGTFTILTGSGPAASTIVTATFGTAFSTNASCSLYPASGSAAQISTSTDIYLDTTTAFFSMIVGIGTLAASTGYTWSYQCNGY